MGTYSRLLILTAKRHAVLSAHLRRFHVLDHQTTQSCPGCRLERTIERQLRAATC
jgi:hypothetical protein